MTGYKFTKEKIAEQIKDGGPDWSGREKRAEGFEGGHGIYLSLGWTRRLVTFWLTG